MDRRVPQLREDVEMSSTFSLVALIIGGSLPPLGAYVSHAKGRGIAEGFVLVTFFSCLGLIVVLCLPTIRGSVGH